MKFPKRARMIVRKLQKRDEAAPQQRVKHVIAHVSRSVTSISDPFTEVHPSSTESEVSVGF
jgi:hypothetical protein